MGITRIHVNLYVKQLTAQFCASFLIENNMLKPYYLSPKQGSCKMSDFTSIPVIIVIYGHFMVRLLFLPRSIPVPKYDIQYLHTKHIVCHVSTQNLQILVSNRRLSHKIMAYNTQTALSRDKLMQKTPGSCPSSGEDRTPVLYATFSAIVAVA